MKILHLVKSRPDKFVKKIIEHQSKTHEVKVINLKKKDISFEEVIDDIFSYNRVISW
jgi:predicted site-specific integrase-resolvase